VIDPHPQIPKKNGREEFVILTYKEFQDIQETLEDADDVLALRQARKEEGRSAPRYSLEEVRMRLGLGEPRKQRKRRSQRR
jgi:hypothetical protein